MNKSSLVAALAEQNEISQKEATNHINAVFGIISEALKKGDEVQISDFGAFKISHRAARTGRNPQTGGEIQIAASKGVKFSAYTALKVGVNK